MKSYIPLSYIPIIDKKNERNAARRKDRKVVKLLTKARELLIGQNLDGKGWTKNAFARRKDRLEVSETSGAAVSFCVMGALTRASHELGADLDTRNEAEDRLDYTMASEDKDIVDTNDDKRTTFPQVLLAFDFAIAGARIPK
jgi:hypothetical protein